MGVKGLWHLLQPTGHPVTLESLEGKVLAVDVSIWLNQTLKGMRDKDGNPLPNAHLLGLFHRVCKLLFYRIKPIFVFDGGVPALKKQTLIARRQRKEVASNKSERASKDILESLLKQHAINAVLGKPGGSTPAPTPSTSSQSNSSQQQKPDLFELPPLPVPLEQPPAYEEEFSWEHRMDQRTVIHAEFQNLDDIDVHSKDFQHLPPEIQHEILTDLKESNRLNSWARLHEMPQESQDFSKFQMDRLRKRSVLSQRLVDVRKEINVRNSGEIAHILTGSLAAGVVESRKLASEDTAHYILIKGLSKMKKDEEDVKLEQGSATLGGAGTSTEDSERKDYERKILEMTREGKDIVEILKAEKEMRKNEIESQNNKKDQSAVKMEDSAENIDLHGSAGSTQNKESVPETKHPGESKSNKLDIKPIINEHETASTSCKVEITVSDDSDVDQSTNDTKLSSASIATPKNAITATSTNAKESAKTVVTIGSSDSDSNDCEVVNEIDNETGVILQRENSFHEMAGGFIIEESDDESLDKCERQNQEIPVISEEFMKENKPLDQADICKERNNSENIEENSMEDAKSPPRVTNLGKKAVIQGSAIKEAHDIVTSSIEDEASTKSHDVSNKPLQLPEQRQSQNQLENAEKNLTEKNLTEKNLTEKSQTEKTEKLHKTEAVPSKSNTLLISESSSESLSMLDSDLEGGRKSEQDQLPEAAASDSSSDDDDFLEIRIYPETAKEDELFPASMFITPNDEISDIFSAVKTNDAPLEISAKGKKVPQQNVPKENVVSSMEDVAPNKEDVLMPDDLQVVNETNEFEGMSREELVEMQNVLMSESSQLNQERGKQQRMAASVTEQMTLEAQELLRLFGVPFIISPMEAEAQCAFLDLTNQIEGSVTDDSDIWLFGGIRVYKNFFNQSKHVEFFKLNDISRQLLVNREKLISLALICGSDYTEGIEGLGPVHGMEILQEFKGEGMEALRDFRKWWEGSRKQLMPPVETKLKGRLRKITVGPGFPSQEVFEAYLKPEVDQSTEKFSWGMPDLDLLRQFTKHKFGWTKTKSDEKLLPVMKRVNENQTQQHITSFFLPTELESEPRKLKSRRVRNVLKRLRNPHAENDEVESPGEKKTQKEVQKTQEEAQTRKEAQNRRGRGRGRGQGQSRGKGTAASMAPKPLRSGPVDLSESSSDNEDRRLGDNLTSSKGQNVVNLSESDSEESKNGDEKSEIISGKGQGVTQKRGSTKSIRGRSSKRAKKR